MEARVLLCKSHREPLRRKVKTGCRTCKIRKVKCDESRPICSRCRTTGRVCDGYGVWGGGGNSYAERYGLVTQQKSLAITMEKSPTKTVALEELRYLQLFQLRFIHTVSGWFGTYFWNQIVLPATALEPAILHAVIALSAAHRCEFQESLALDVRQRFMLQQYSKAMQLLQSMIQHKDRESMKIVLVACQIFTFLEYLRGRPTVAEAHLLNGLRLLGNVQKDDSDAEDGAREPRPLDCKTNVDRGIAQRFAALHIQASLFGRHLASTSSLIRPLEIEIPYTTFSSIYETKDLLDSLLQRALLLNQHFQHLDANAPCPPILILAKQHVTTLLAAWLQTFHRTLQQPAPPHERIHSLGFGSQPLPHNTNSRSHLAYTLLLNYHTMAHILSSTLSPPCSSELRYTAHTAHFLTILSGSMHIWKMYQQARQIPGNVELAHSIGEFGPTAPLYYTALKCRVSRIRRHAVRLLGGVAYKEGVWDTVVARRVAGLVVELEEGKSVGDEGFEMDEEPELDEMEECNLAEERLFHDVKVQMVEESDGRAAVECRRWRRDGKLEVVKSRLEGECWVREGEESVEE